MCDANIEDADCGWQELRDEVDVNFDGRISFLEYLLYQYKDVANPADFCHRSMVSYSLSSFNFEIIK